MFRRNMGCSSQKNNQLAALKRVGSLRPKKIVGIRQNTGYHIISKEAIMQSSDP